MVILFAISSIFALVFLYYVLKQEKNISALKEDVDAYRKIAAEAQNLYEIERENAGKLLHTEYTTTDADLVKYKSEKAMDGAIKSRLAVLIGNDIQKNIDLRIVNLGEGKKKYSYIFKIKNV